MVSVGSETDPIVTIGQRGLNSGFENKLLPMSQELKTAMIPHKIEKGHDNWPHDADGNKTMIPIKTSREGEGG